MEIWWKFGRNWGKSGGIQDCKTLEPTMDLQQFLTFPTTSWVRKQQQKEGLGNLGIEPAMWIYTA